jgi:hypothetical protein
MGSVIRERIQEGDDADLNACLPLGPLANDLAIRGRSGVLIKIKALPTE